MDDATFLRLFEESELPYREWHHRAHLKVAYLFLRRYPFDEAAERVRDGIKAFNRAKGVREGPTSGYHETTTIAWLRLVAAVLAKDGPADAADAFVEAHPELSKPAMRLFYSRERFMSSEAKATFLEPDLTPFPVLFEPCAVPVRRVLAIGDGLTLRPVEATDAEEVFTAARESIAEVSPWMSWCDERYTLSHARSWTSRQAQLWAHRKEFTFVLEEDGREGVVGAFGLNALAAENRFCNLGYWIRTSRVGRGFASRAARRVAHFGIEEVGLHRIEIVVATGNARSQRTAERAGARREGVLRQRLVVRDQIFDAVMFSLTRDSFTASKR